MDPELVQAQLDLANAQSNLLDKQYALQKININNKVSELQAQLTRLKSPVDPAQVI